MGINPDSQSSPDDRPLSGDKVLRELAVRWRAADTLEYRSRAILDHLNEFRIDVRLRVQLRRPNRARLVFSGDHPEANRVRVSDGTWIYDRMRVQASTQRLSLQGGNAITAEISHPLDEAGYSVDQFFAPSPFLPPPTWGDGKEPLTITAVRTRAVVDAPRGDRRDVLRLSIRRGRFEDTLWLDPISFAPLKLRRFGVHGGRPQELLNETFSDMRLGFPLAPSLFVWTRDDEAGIVR